MIVSVLFCCQQMILYRHYDMTFSDLPYFVLNSGYPSLQTFDNNNEVFQYIFEIVTPYFFRAVTSEVTNNIHPIVRAFFFLCKVY